MRFEEALKYLKDGKEIRIKGTNFALQLCLKTGVEKQFCVDIADILFAEWELIE